MRRFGLPGNTVGREGRALLGSSRTGLRVGVSTVIVALLASLVPAAATAAPASSHEITAVWAGDPAPTSAPFGQPVTAEWRVNTNDVDDPYSNEPVDNVRATLTAGNGVFTSIPSVCKTRDVTPTSSISDDGATLVCNLGTVKEGTSTIIQTPLRASSADGGDLTVTGTATSDTAVAEVGPADPGPLPITYSYGMDLSLDSVPGATYQGAVKPSRTGGSRVFVQMNYSLILAAGSRPGPSDYSFPVTVSTNVPNGLAGLQWEGCVPIGTEARSTGQPYSDPAQTDRTNFPTCSVTGSGTTYQVSLSNLDYSLVNTPTVDSLGQPLGGNGAYIASGTVQFSIPSPVTQVTNVVFSASPGPFTFTDGTVRADGNAPNNSSDTTLVPPGGFTNAWYGSPTYSRSAWDTNLWVSPGTSVGVPLPQPGIDDQDDWEEAIANGTYQRELPLYHQANSSFWNTYQGSGGAQLAGICTMTQNPSFVPTSFEGGGWDQGTGEYVHFTTARFFYTTESIDTKAETCGDPAPSAKWVEAIPPAGHVLTDPRVGSDIMMTLPAGVTAVKMTWNPAVDRPRTAHGYAFLRAFGHIDPNAATSGEGWTIGAFNTPADAAATWPGYPTRNNWVNLSTMPGGAVIPGSTYGPNANGIRDAFRLQGPQGLLEKVVSSTTAEPGVPVTYTLRAQAQNLTTSPPPVSFSVVDTLPAGMEYVAGSGQPAPSSVSADGRTLTWNYTDVDANVFQDIRYQAQRPVDSVIAPGTNLVNTAVINVPGDNRPANTPGRTATAVVTVPSASATLFGKSVEANVLSFEGDSSAWVLTVNSQDPVASDFTDTIDILPAVGDGRGTDIDGSYTITDVDAPSGSTVYYSTAPLAELSTDPRDASNGGTPGSISGNTVGWSTTPVEHPTAIRIVGPELAPGASQVIRIAFDTPAGASCEAPAEDDNKPGQILVNTASSWAEHTALPMLSSSVTQIANCYGVNLKKFVQDADGEWVDANSTAEFPTYRVGDEVSYRIVAKNIGQGTLKNVEITDALFPEGSFVIDELARGEERVHEFTVTMTGGGTVVNNACGTADTPPDAEAPTILCDPAGVEVVNYATQKSSDPASGETVNPGDTITYTVAVTQEGTVPAVAQFSDDLSAVLDDATYNGDVSASIGTASVEDGVLSWNGTVPVGEVATVTYSVTVKDSAALAADGDYTVGNQVTSPGCGSAGDCTTEHPVADYSVVKSSDPADGSNVEVGDSIEYTVTVSQLGEAAFDGASLVDDLTGVLDDATWNDDLSASAGSVDFDPVTAQLSWSGDLAIDDVVTITYSVTVTGEGDTSLRNVVTSDGCSSAGSCSTQHYTATYTTVKTADPASGSNVEIGDVITYTVTVTQSGEGRVVAQFFNDDLSGVLDDATFNDDIVASAGEFTYADGVISWTGDLGPGDVATVTYSVTVTAAGDTRIGNTVQSPGCETASTCETEHLTGRYETVKTSDPASGDDVQIGDTIDYTVTVSQIGEAAVTDASFSDDLTAVLDDATWNDDLDASAGDVDFTSPTISWSGDLGVDDVVTVTYSVTVTGEGDMALTNVVTSDGCADAASCTTTHQTGDYTVSKTSVAAPGSDVAVGDVITYTVTVAQRGPGAVTGASFDDDLSEVLDDATWNDDVAATAGDAAFDAESAELAWSGDLAVGATVSITYSVTVTGDGDMSLTNVVTPGENGECVPAGDGNEGCSTTHQTGRFTFSKMADPAHNSDVQAGDVVTYMVTVEQQGPAGVVGALVDDLSDVLDDATYNGDAAATAGSVAVEGSTLTWGGDLAAGDAVTITYSVTVTGAGNTTLANVVTSPSEAGECVPASDGTEECRTVHKTGGYVFSKSADPESGTEVRTGETVTYTLTVTQRGDGVVTDAIVTDDLSGVLDDARWNDDAKATAGAVSREGNRLTWAGDLGVGESVEITYSVTVTGTGPAELRNVVTSPDERAICDPGGSCVTEHEVPPTPPLAITGGTVAGGLAGLAGLLLIGGAVLLAARRRQRDRASIA